MQIVIEILEEQYNKIKELKMFEYGNYVALLDAVLTSIKNGAPLPKSHGRLIDAVNLEKKAASTYDMYMLHEIDEEPTIIEADNAESEDEK